MQYVYCIYLYLFFVIAIQYVHMEKLESLRVLTCNECVLDAESETLQLLIASELDPHEAPGGSDQSRVLPSAHPVDERREAEGPVADLDVIEAALEGRLDVVVLVERQLDPLPGQCCLVMDKKVHVRAPLGSLSALFGS